MLPDERRYSEKWFYQCIQSRYGFNPHHLRLADACEIFIGQGCKVGPGRPPDGPEGDRPGGRDALAAGRHRPAFAGAPPRLARTGRPGTQDRRAARGDQRRDPDPAQARRGSGLRRRPHGGQDRAGQHLHRRHGGLDRRRPAHRHRGDRRSGHRRHPPGTQGAGRRRQDRARSRWSTRAASATAPTWPRRWRSVRTPWPSAPRR